MAEKRNPQTGARVRARRLDAGLRQSELAAKAGISASYLNLIEHDRRRIGGKLLADIARALDVDPAQLTDGAARGVVAGMLAAATGADAAPEFDRAEDLATRYPGWAALIAAQRQRVHALEAQVRALSDRMTHDPALAQSMHAVITSVTAIRSAAAILTSDPTLDADWMRRFHRNIHDDAVRLAETSEALLQSLDAPETDTGRHLSPVAEVAAWFAARANHLPALEANPAEADALAGAAGLSPAARAVLQHHLATYAAMARALPLRAVIAHVAAQGYAPAALAAAFGVDLRLAFWRLATLPPGGTHPPHALVLCDGAGVLRLQLDVPGLSLPRDGLACPLWPLFTAIGQPGRPELRDVVLPDSPDVRLRCTALAVQLNPGDFTLPPIVEAAMLVQPDAPDSGTPPLPIGLTCRICPREGCPARREPSVLRGGAGHV